MTEPLYLEVFREEAGIKGFFSTKYGANPGSPYDNPQVLKQLGLEHMQMIWPEQVHKDHIEVIDKRGEGPVSLPNTDGLITNVSGVLLTTVHADCLPVWFYDPEKRAIGLVHAGWRGTAAGIAAKAVGLLEQHYGSEPKTILCSIGPGISACCFEVGPEVYEIFKEKWAFAEEFAQRIGDTYKMDLKGLNCKQLTEAGILEDQIEISPHCTYCEPELFCSYRREGGTYLRMGAGICLL